MKIIYSHFFILFLYISFTFAFDQQVQYDQITKRLDDKKEIYFSFTRNNSTDLELLSSKTNISLDRVDGNIVYAYLSTHIQFNDFLLFGYPYKIEINPSELFDVECSDYENYRIEKRFDAYPTYKGYQNILNQYESEYPDLCKVVDIGVTERGKKVLGLVITKNNDIPKPRVLWLGAVHGDELTGTVCSFKMFKYLVTKYQADDKRVVRILDSIEIWTVPFENLDGTYAVSDNTVTGAKRSNANGVDLNRSFICPPGINKGSKEQQETRNIHKLVKETRFSVGADSHGGIECYIYPWCCQKKDHPQKALYRTVGSKLIDKTVGGIKKGMGNAFETVNYVAKGTQADYLDYYGNMLGWTFEMSGQKLIPTNKFDTYWNKFREMMLTYYELGLVGIQGVVSDTFSSVPIADVEITVKGEESTNIKRFSYKSGFYSRMISAGKYDLTFKHKNYRPKTIVGVVSKNLKQVKLSVKLYPLVTKELNEKSMVSFSKVTKKSGKIIFDFSNCKTFNTLKVYNIKGMLVQSIERVPGNSSIIWNYSSGASGSFAKGCYVLKFISNNGSTVSKILLD